MKVFVCGGGVVGASIAYFLSLRQVEVIVVERAGLACAASGKSGGFLALDWCDGTPLAPLARRSFALHAELAERLENNWDYRRVDTFGVFGSARRPVRVNGNAARPNWLGPDIAVHRQLGTTETTAQVHPAKFTAGMMSAAENHGAKLHIGCVTGLTFTPDGSAVTGANVDGEEIQADAVVIAMGPWSVLASQWLPLPATYGLLGYSLILEPDAPIPPQTLFAEFESEDGATYSPEIVPRPDGTTYVCGMSAETPLPVDPQHVAPDSEACRNLLAITAQISPILGAAKVLAQQACYRPVIADGMPIIGSVSGLDGAYIATGHSVWGILNAPATGEAMARLIVDGTAQDIDLSPFTPGRLKPVRPEEVRLQGV